MFWLWSTDYSTWRSTVICDHNVAVFSARICSRETEPRLSKPRLRLTDSKFKTGAGDDDDVEIIMSQVHSFHHMILRFSLSLWCRELTGEISKVCVSSRELSKRVVSKHFANFQILSELNCTLEYNSDGEKANTRKRRKEKFESWKLVFTFNQNTHKFSDLMQGESHSENSYACMHG